MHKNTLRMLEGLHHGYTLVRARERIERGEDNEFWSICTFELLTEYDPPEINFIEEAPDFYGAFHADRGEELREEDLINRAGDAGGHVPFGFSPKGLQFAQEKFGPIRNKVVVVYKNGNVILVEPTADGTSAVAPDAHPLPSA